MSKTRRCDVYVYLGKAESRCSSATGRVIKPVPGECFIVKSSH